MTLRLLIGLAAIAVVLIWFGRDSARDADSKVTETAGGEDPGVSDGNETTEGEDAGASDGSERLFHADPEGEIPSDSLGGTPILREDEQVTRTPDPFPDLPALDEVWIEDRVAPAPPQANASPGPRDTQALIRSYIRIITDPPDSQGDSSILQAGHKIAGTPDPFPGVASLEEAGIDSSGAPAPLRDTRALIESYIRIISELEGERSHGDRNAP